MKEVNLNRVRKQPCWVETPRTPCYRRGQARETVAPTWQCCAEDKMRRQSSTWKPFRHRATARSQPLLGFVMANYMRQLDGATKGPGIGQTLLWAFL